MKATSKINNEGINKSTNNKEKKILKVYQRRYIHHHKKFKLEYILWKLYQKI